MANEFVARNGIISKGGFTTPHKVVSSGYQITVDDYLIECSGSFTVTLPNAVGIEGKHYIIKNNGSLIISIATTLSQTIDGVTSMTLAAHSSIQLISTGANWINVLIGDSNTLDGLDSTSFALTTSLNGTQNYLTKYGASGITQSSINDNGSRVDIQFPLRVNYKTFYNVAQRINTSGNETGTIYIELPFGWTSNMGTYEIDIYNYNSNTKAKIIVSGYNYGSGVWVNTSLQIVGSLPSNVVRLGYNSNTSKCCILIGTTSTVWAYPQIYVSKVTQGFGNSADWSTGWTISVITSETDITAIVQPTANVGMMLNGKTLTQQISDNDGRYLGITASAVSAKKLTDAITITDFTTFNPTTLGLAVGEIKPFYSASANNRPVYPNASGTSIATGYIEYVYIDYYKYIAYSANGTDFAIGAYNSSAFQGWTYYTTTNVINSLSNNYLSRWDDTNNKFINSLIYDNGTNVGIGTTAPNEQLEITKNFQLPNTTGTTPYGIIYKDGSRFIHDFNYGNNGTVTTTGGNTFVGLNAGNLTMGSTATSASQASYNTGIGYISLYSNTTGSQNTANGYSSLYSNTTGNSNTANGYSSLASNTTGSSNTAMGRNSLASNTMGSSNTALGYYSLYSNTTGSYNTALGLSSGRYIADGSTGRSTGNNGLYLGYNSKASADGTDNEIVIGFNAVGKGSNTATYGNSSMAKHIFEAGNVGIGTTNPIAKLQIGNNWVAYPLGNNVIHLGSSGFANINKIPEMLVTTNNSSTIPDIIGLALHNSNNTPGAYAPLLVFSKVESDSSPYNTSLAAIGARTVTGSGSGSGWIDGELMFYTSPSSGSGLLERMRISENGNVGIGTTAPVTKAHIDGVLTINPGSNSNYSEGIRIASSTNGYSGVHLGVDPTVANGYQTNQWWIGKDGRDHGFNIFGGSKDVFHILSSGNVGINTITPYAKLHTKGSMIVGNGPQTSVLSTNSLGIHENSGVDTALGFWQNGIASSLIGHKANDSILYLTNTTGGSILGYLPNSIALKSNGNVGIGIDPTEKLDVNGNVKANEHKYSTGTNVGSRYNATDQTIEFYFS